MSKADGDLSALQSPTDNVSSLARKCRIEAVRAMNSRTKAFLLDLAAYFEAAAGECVIINPDDTELQGAVADRLESLAAKRRI